MKILAQKEVKSIKEQEVYFGDLPLMTQEPHLL